MHKSYNNLILAKVEKKFDNLMPFTAMIAFLSAVVISVSNIPFRFVIFNVIIGFIFVFVYIFREKLVTEYKIIVLVMAPLIIGISIFMDGGFSSSGLPLIMISNVVSVMYLSKKKSDVIAVLSVLVMAFLWIYTSLNPIVIPEGMKSQIWVLQIFVFISFLIILKTVVFSIRGYLIENIEELEKSLDEIYYLAYKDQLTGLPNQHLFKEELVKRSREGIKNGFLVIVNIRNLNKINSIYSEDVGDKVLKQCVDLIKDCLKNNEIGGRIAGSEFAIWFENVTFEDFISRIKFFESKINSDLNINNMSLKIHFYGSYARHYEGEDILECYRKASVAMTYAKSNHIDDLLEYNQKLKDTIHYEELLKDALENAIDHKTFTLAYQYKYNPKKDTIIGVEALARWHSDTLGHIGPNVFVPMLEEMNHANDLGEIVIDKALKDYHHLRNKYNKDISISINISPSHIMSDGFIDYLSQKIKEHHVNPKKIILEITEEVLIEGLEKTKQLVDAIKALGVRISLDDFGTGYSSLNYLTQINIDEIKIDKSFVDQIGTNERVEFMLNMLIDLSAQYELDIVAEGVETLVQCDQILNMGCHVIQGYLYSKPEAL